MVRAGSRIVTSNQARKPLTLLLSRAALYASGSADTPGIVAVASRWGVRLEGS